MLSKILIRLSILALCFTAFSASAEWLPSNTSEIMSRYVIHELIPTVLSSAWP